MLKTTNKQTNNLLYILNTFLEILNIVLNTVNTYILCFFLNISELRGRAQRPQRRTVATALLVSVVREVGQPRQVAGLQVEAVVVARLHFFLVRLGRATQSTRATQVAPEQAASQGTT